MSQALLVSMPLACALTSSLPLLRHPCLLPITIAVRRELPFILSLICASVRCATRESEVGESWAGKCLIQVCVEGGKVNLSEAIAACNNKALPQNGERYHPQMARFLKLDGAPLDTFLQASYNASCEAKSQLLVSLFAQASFPLAPSSAAV